MMAKHVYISGRVQGVFFRSWVHKHALRLGLQGWVRNLSDGRVEAFFAGSHRAVSHMLALCHKGPLLAYVAAVTARDADLPDLPSVFYIADSA